MYSRTTGKACQERTCLPTLTTAAPILPPSPRTAETTRSWTTVTALSPSLPRAPALPASMTPTDGSSWLTPATSVSPSTSTTTAPLATSATIRTFQTPSGSFVLPPAATSKVGTSARILWSSPAKPARSSPSYILRVAKLHEIRNFRDRLPERLRGLVQLPGGRGEPPSPAAPQSITDPKAPASTASPLSDPSNNPAVSDDTSQKTQ